MIRLRDTLFSGVALFALSPFLLMLSLLVWVRLGWPIVFRQQRPGLNGKPFYLYKFRSMTNERYSDGSLKSDAERLTSFGKALRSTSLDELPALFNVLRGEMSLVGPRPLLMRYLPRYSPWQIRRLEVRPGITGWAQINGRNAISWEQKFEFDVWYVDNRSFWLDCKILVATVSRVCKRDGISSAESATMEEFMGNSDRVEPIDL